MITTLMVGLKNQNVTRFFFGELGEQFCAPVSCLFVCLRIEIYFLKFELIFLFCLKFEAEIYRQIKLNRELILIAANI